MAKYHNFLLIFCVFIFLGLSNDVIGATTGKISGIIKDAETGEPLPGVNIVIEGTTMGAASNIKGEYFILNVPPQKHTLVATMMGYAKYRETNVSVFTDRTTIINMSLKTETIQGEEVTIVAERPIIQQDVSASEIVTDGAAVVELPSVVDVKDFINMQAGVEDMMIRGGSIDQTALMIDGAVMVDPTTNKPYTGVNLSAIQEVSVIMGGFNAEYGNVRSGMIQIVTKEGSDAGYHGSIDVRMNKAHQKHFGPSLFSPLNPFIRPYLDPTVCWDGTQSGGWSELTQDQYEQFAGWNKYVEDNPDLGLTAEQARDLFTWIHTVDAYAPWGIKGAEALGNKPRTYGNKSDWQGDFSLSGPVPVIGKFLGDMTFFGSYRSVRDYLTFPFVRDNNWTEDMQLKLVSKISPSMKLTLQGVYSELEAVSEDWGYESTGNYITDNNALNIANDNADYIYWQGAYSPLDIYHSMTGITFDHVLSPSTYYTIKYNRTFDKYFANGFDRQRDTTIIKTIGNVRLDEVPWGYTLFPFQEYIDQPDQRRFGEKGGMIHDGSKAATDNFRFDLTSQVNTNNQFKGGLEFVYTDMDVNRKMIRLSQAELGSDWWSREYRAFPLRGAIYLQDKIEAQGMIANLGVRADYFDANTDAFTADPYSDYFKPEWALQFYDVVPRVKAKAFWKVSPRLGISHPISENAKLYFNYGHFYAYPMSNDLYGLVRGGFRTVTKIGNPNADLPKTVAYELGVDLNAMNMFLIHMAGYYKDITSQLAYVNYENFEGSVKYSAIKNQNYADIRGFELRIEKNIGTWIKGWLNYTYMVTSNGFVGRESYYQDLRREYLEGLYNPYQEIPLARPYFRANLDLSTPDNWGPVMLGHNYLGGWRLSLLPMWKAGSFSTNNPLSKVGIRDNIQWPDYYKWDARLTKYVKLKGTTVALFVDVTNLFNQKNFSTSAFRDSDDRQKYLESLHLPMYDAPEYKNAGLTPGDDKPGDMNSKDKPYINDPDLTHSLWGFTRNIVFGLRFDF